MAEWKLATDAPPVPPREFRPSLWAALDVPFKVVGAVLLVLVPFGIGGAWVAADPYDPLGFLLPASLLVLVQAGPAALVALAPAVQIAFTRYLVDEDGIRVRVDILSKRESRVAWHKVTAIQHRRTIIDRVFGIGRLDIVAYGERGTTLRLVGLRDAPALRDFVAQQMRRHATVEALLRND